MKIWIYTVIFTIGLLACSSSDDDTQKDIVAGTWNVQNISGGFAGINDDYAPGTIIWAFNPANQTLQVTNNNEADTIYDGLPTGQYSYSVLSVENELFLQINDQEFSGITIFSRQLLLDENKKSTGTGADGFQIVLSR
ncbi:MAG: hypothetical protein R2819_10915 [Allomuricauda sp.]